MKRYNVFDKKGRWHASYDASLSIANQPDAFVQARITAKHPKVRGRVEEEVDGVSTVVFEDK